MTSALITKIGQAPTVCLSLGITWAKIVGYGSVANGSAPNLVLLINLRASTGNAFVSGLTVQYFTVSGTAVRTAVSEGSIDAANLMTYTATNSRDPGTALAASIYLKSGLLAKITLN